MPRLKDRHVDSCVVIVWAYFCWRDGVGFVFASLSLTFSVAEFRVHGGVLEVFCTAEPTRAVPALSFTRMPASSTLAAKSLEQEELSSVLAVYLE
ncbi:hypothetical protein NDU88_005793 [Pleurodeles waltl]|uniref:Secreted protein n=1 Tax=Pleurodeles waltl TaxID=8319 RepID=A0AAV7VMT5_PLEWA|nr:hypothetical protein NDU88_005793 [Pleurodeles waltl]